MEVISTKAWIDRFLEDIELRGYSFNTISMYKLILNQFYKYCDKKPILVEDMNKIDIMEFLRTYPKISKRSLLVYQNIVRSFTRYLYSNNIIPDMPKYRNIKFDKTIPKSLNKTDIRTMYSNLESDFERMIIGLLVETGLRVSEACNILKSDINWNARSVVVRNTKGNADRTVFVSQKTADLLFAHSNESKIDCVIHSPIRNCRINRQDMYYVIKKISERIGIKIHPHSLRHSFSKMFYNANNSDIRMLQIALGHKSIMTTTGYLSILAPEMKEGFSKVVITDVEKGGDSGIISTK